MLSVVKVRGSQGLEMRPSQIYSLPFIAETREKNWRHYQVSALPLRCPPRFSKWNHSRRSGRRIHSSLCPNTWRLLWWFISAWDRRRGESGGFLWNPHWRQPEAGAQSRHPHHRPELWRSLLPRPHCHQRMQGDEPSPSWGLLRLTCQNPFVVKDVLEDLLLPWRQNQEAKDQLKLAIDTLCIRFPPVIHGPGAVSFFGPSWSSPLPWEKRTRGRPCSLIQQDRGNAWIYASFLFTSLLLLSPTSFPALFINC